MNTVVEQEACDFLKKLQKLPVKAKIILTDPPYGMNYKSGIPGHKNWNKTGKAKREVSKIKNDVSLKDVDWGCFFSAAYDALDEHGVMVMFCNDKALHHWVTEAQKAGFEWKDTAIWNKKCANGGDLKWPFINVVEYLIFFVKENGKPQCNKLHNHDDDLKHRVINVFHYGRVPKGEHEGHPTQKPIYLCGQIIRAFSNKGDLVVDPFAGSGSSLIAAKKLDRQFYGCDIDPVYVAISNDRLARSDEIEVKSPKKLKKDSLEVEKEHEEEQPLPLSVAEQKAEYEKNWILMPWDEFANKSTHFDKQMYGFTDRMCALLGVKQLPNTDARGDAKIGAYYAEFKAARDREGKKVWVFKQIRKDRPIDIYMFFAISDSEKNYLYVFAMTKENLLKELSSRKCGKSHKDGTELNLKLDRHNMNRWMAHYYIHDSTKFTQTPYGPQGLIVNPNDMQNIVLKALADENDGTLKPAIPCSDRIIDMYEENGNLFGVDDKDGTCASPV